MSSPTRRVVGPLTLTAALALTACGGGTTEESDPGTTATTSTTGPSSPDQTSAESTPTDSEGASGDTPKTQTTSATESTGSTSSTPAPTSHDDSPGSRAKRSQIAKSDLPGLNDQWQWNRSNGAGGPRRDNPAPSVCMRASLTAIGGVTEYSTQYTKAGVPEDEAFQMTAVFPDEPTAQMAESVLAAWQRTCRSYVAQRDGVDRVQVSADRTVASSVGPGHQRLVIYSPAAGDPDAGYFNGEGYVRDGDVLTYLVFHSVGQDYNYQLGKEPVDLGLAVAGDYLERSR